MNKPLRIFLILTKRYGWSVKSNENDEWKTADTVSDSTDIEENYLLQEPVKARYVRLNITKPDRSEGLLPGFMSFKYIYYF